MVRGPDQTRLRKAGSSASPTFSACQQWASRWAPLPVEKADPTWPISVLIVVARAALLLVTRATPEHEIFHILCPVFGHSGGKKRTRGRLGEDVSSRA